MPSSDPDCSVSSTDIAPPETPGDKPTGEWAEISTYDAPPPAPVEPRVSTDPLAATDPAASPAPSIPDAHYIQHYEVIRELGRGGMGVVHLARDLRLGRLVAIKQLTKPGHHQERFLAEARATARCRHENIVVIHDVGIHSEQPYLVFEYLRGQTLREWMETRTGGAFDIQDTSGSSGQIPSPLAPARAVEMIVPVVRALACAHDMGIIHRDLKPANILLTEDGHTKVLDFGVAKIGAVREDLAGEDAAGSNEPLALTALGARLGTLPYMSPEQLAGEVVDHRSDIWAVGIILYELVTGAHPLAPLSMAKIQLIADLATPMPSVREHRSDLGPLADIISRCLLKDREHRTATARELLQNLEALLPAQRTRARDDESNPFAGLTAFQESDAGRFFGRDHEVTSLVGKLRSLPLVAVTGPSGAGKSSVVRAGVIPALKRSGEGWEALITRPGRQPLAALAEVLLAMSVRSSEMPTGRGISRGADQVPGERDAIIARLRTEPGYLGITLRTWARAKLRRVLLFVDQFEELYTLGADAEERACVLACLGAVADDTASPLRVILSVRSDFLDRLVERRTFLDIVSHGLNFLTPLGRGGLREVLTRPVEACDHRFESPAMVERILNELHATRSPLPLLQFTADKLWSRRDRQQRMLTESSLDALGGVGGALASHADAILVSMPAQDARLARAAFLRLVTPERTRALATLAELRQLGRNAEMDRVLTRLIDARLLAVEGSAAGQAGSEHPDGVVELVHESLIDSWPHLTRWLAENEEDATFLARLRSAARDWQRSGQGPGLLWSGQAAREAHAWHQRYQGELAADEEQYLAAVTTAVERQRWLRRRILGAVFAGVAMVATLMSYLAWREAKARDEASEAAARATQEASTAQQVSSFLVNMFEAFDPYKAAGNEITAREILDRGAARIDTELRDQPVIRARLMHIMGVVYGNLGHYPEAIALLEQALATRQRLHGQEHLEIAETQQALADVLADRLELARAEELYRQALATRRELLGDEHLLVADSLHGLADVLLGDSKPEQARPLAQRALELRRQLLVEAHPAIAASLQLLGTVQLFDGTYGEAEAAFREAIDMCRKTLGEDALEVSEAQQLLAKTIATGKNDYRGAEELLEQSLAVQRRALGESHIAVAHTLHELAELARKRGDIEHAEELLHRALGIYRASLDSQPLPLTTVLYRLAQLAESRGDHARATELATEAVEVYRQAQGKETGYFALVVADLGFFLHAQGRLAEAEAPYRQALAMQERLSGADAEVTRRIRIDLAALLIDAGRLEEAAPLVEALDGLPDGPGADDDWLLYHARSVLGAYLGRIGQRAQAEDLLATSYAALQESRGAGARLTREALRRLVAYYENIGMPAKARPYRAQLRGNGNLTP